MGVSGPASEALDELDQAVCVRISIDGCRYNTLTLILRGEELPFADETFDIVYARQVLHHAQDLDQLCCEVRRVLKKKGVFIATREHVISRYEDLGRFFANHPLHHLYGGENAFLLKDYLCSIKSAKLKLIKLLGPYDSAINLFPQSPAEMKNEYNKWIYSKFGERIGKYLYHDFFYMKYLRLRTKRDHTPGRLYSFIAQK